MPALLTVHDLKKHYPKVRAVDGVSFEVQEGSCFGLLGPNGAGKSTTIEMLEGLAKPTSGEIQFRGQSIAGAGSLRYRERIGIQFQSTALQEFLTPRENLRFFSALYPKGTPIEQLVETCHLAEYLDRDSSKLSGGQRQRLLLAVALVNDPELVFLDEPTTGLDPQARRNFWDLVQSIKARGKTVVLTTHYMEEAYLLCDEIGIMDHGRMIARGSPQKLLAEHFNDSVLELPLTDLNGRTPPAGALVSGDRVEMMSRDVNASVRELLDQGVSLEHLQVRARTLEDLFLELTGKDLRS